MSLIWIRHRGFIRFEKQSNRNGRDSVLSGVPLKIFSSAVTGRRYVCMYNPSRRRFQSYRLDYIKSVAYLDIFDEYVDVRAALERNLGMVWGVSFGGKTRKEMQVERMQVEC